MQKKRGSRITVRSSAGVKQLCLRRAGLTGGIRHRQLDDVLAISRELDANRTAHAITLNDCCLVAD
jgi:hypothetical protein